MSEILKRRTDETKWQYVKRITDNRKEYDMDYSEWAKAICDYDCSSDNGRKAYYIVKPLLEQLENEVVELLTKACSGSAENDLMLEIEEKKRELFKERVRLQDVQREINTRLRWEARWEALAEAIVNAMQAKPSLNIEHKQVDSEIEACLILSDWHLGLAIDTPHNHFNREVATERVEHLVAETIKYCQIHNVKTLNIDICGDILSGLIHTTTRIYQQMDVVEQVGFACELISLAIEALAPSVEKIRLHSVTGNHDRINANYKEHLHEENFTRLIEWGVTARTGMEFEKSGIDQEVEVYRLNNGRVVAMEHGHNCKKPQDAVKNLSEYLNMDIDYVHLGHFHNFQTAYNTVINGCLCGSDTFANQHRYNNAPSQTLVVYYPDGSRALHEIILK